MCFQIAYNPVTQVITCIKRPQEFVLGSKLKLELRLLIYAGIETTQSDRVREIVLSLTGHFKLFAGHLIEFNYSSSPDIPKIRWTCPASPANFAYSGVNRSLHFD